MRSVVLAVILLLAGSPVLAAFHKLGGLSTGNLAKDVSIIGDHALVAWGYDGFRVLDISNPASPTQVFSFPTEGPAWRIEQSGSRAYVLDWWEGVLIFDVSQPAAPVLLGESTPFNMGNDIAVEGNRLYAGTSSGIRVMDVTDPAHVTLQHVFFLNGGAASVQKEGNTIYSAGFDTGVLIIDATNPVSFYLRCAIPTNDRAYDLAVAGGIAYVADGYAGLLVLDITDPTQPITLDQVPLPGCVKSVEVVGSTVHVSDQECGFHVFDVSDPSNLVAIGSFHVPGVSGHSSVGDGLVCLTSNYRGVQILDIQDPAIPALLGEYRDVSGTWDVKVKEGLAFLADEYEGLVVLDVTSPEQPVRVGGLDVYGAERCLDVSGSLLACGTDYFGGGNIEFFTTLPDRGLQHAGTHIAWGAVSSVSLRGGICYASVSDDEFRCIECVDVEDPSKPVLLSRTVLEEPIVSLCVDGTYVYCAVMQDGLLVYDFQNPSFPIRCGSLDTADFTSGIAKSGNYLYVADQEGGLLVVDVTDPSLPVLRETVRPHRDSVISTRPWIRGDFLYVADENWNTIGVYGLGDPVHPTPMAEHRWGYTSSGLFATDGLLFAASHWAGLSILELPEPAGAPEPSTAGARLALCNHPNPFHSTTQISFVIPEGGGRSGAASGIDADAVGRGAVDVAVYDAAGRRVRTLQSGWLSAGAHSVDWSGENDHGRAVPSGVYFCRAQIGSQAVVRRVVRIR